MDWEFQISSLILALAGIYILMAIFKGVKSIEQKVSRIFREVILEDREYSSK